MGTNYYLHSKPCATCGHSETKKHIGKSSSGWQFQFRGYRDENIVSYEDWANKVTDPNNVIITEYGGQVSPGDFFNIVHSSRIGMNSYNIGIKLPMTQKERDYLTDRTLSHIPNDELCKNSWKDNDGYAFTDSEFC